MMEAMPTAIFSMKAKTALSVVGAFSGSLIGMFDSWIGKQGGSNPLCVDRKLSGT